MHRALWRVTAIAVSIWVVSPTVGSAPGNGNEEAVVVADGVVAYIEESSDDVLARERFSPTPCSGRALVPIRLPDYEQTKPQLDSTPGSGPARGGAADEVAGISFNGPAICNCEPPDPILTVGPSHVLMAINDQIRCALKASGLTLWSMNWESFFASVKPAGGTFTSDPKVFYDPGSQRYFAVLLYINSASTRSWWMLAVSSSSNINGATIWRKWALDPTVATPGYFADYPGFGFDESAVYITSNMFLRGSPTHVDMAVIPKAQLLVATPTPTFTQLTDIMRPDGPRAFTIQPALMYGSGDCIFASTTGGTGSKVYFYGVNDPLGVPSLTKAACDVAAYARPADAPQPGGGAIDAGDARMLNAVWQNGRLWCAHTTDFGGLAAARWYEFDTTPWPDAPTVVQSGTVSDPGNHYYFPSVAVDQLNNAALGFTRSSSNEYASTYHTSRLATDPLGSMGPPVLNHAGGAHYGGTRWGDFSGTVIDPTNGLIFWTLQEYAQGSGTGWGTWAASFSMRGADSTPPTPDPMTFEILPHATSADSITMRATLATDALSPPVSYFFDLVAGGPGGGPTGWQSGRDFTDDGLLANTRYTYRVQARDSALIPNVGAFSGSTTVCTFGAVPAAPDVTAGPSSVTLNLDTGGNPPDTEFAVRCAATGDANWIGRYVNVSGQPSASAVWQTAAQWGTFVLYHVLLAKPYCFEVLARNRDLVATEPSANGCGQTLAATLPGDTNCDGHVNSEDIFPFVQILGNPAAWQAATPNCPMANADLNGDGVVSYADINPFVALLVR